MEKRNKDNSNMYTVRKKATAARSFRELCRLTCTNSIYEASGVQYFSSA